MHVIRSSHHPDYMLFQPYPYANAHPSRSNAENTGSTPHVAKQVILSSAEVLLWSSGRCSSRCGSSSDRADMTPAAKFLLLLRDRSGGGRRQRTGVAPASKVVVVLHGLRRLGWLGLGLCFSWCWRRIGLGPGIVITPWVAVTARDRERVHSKRVVLCLCRCWSSGRHGLLPRWRDVFRWRGRLRVKEATATERALLLCVTSSRRGETGERRGSRQRWRLHTSKEVGIQLWLRRCCGGRRGLHGTEVGVVCLWLHGRGQRWRLHAAEEIQV